MRVHLTHIIYYRELCVYTLLPSTFMPRNCFKARQVKSTTSPPCCHDATDDAAAYRRCWQMPNYIYIYIIRIRMYSIYREKTIESISSTSSFASLFTDAKRHGSIQSLPRAFQWVLYSFCIVAVVFSADTVVACFSLLHIAPPWAE